MNDNVFPVLELIDTPLCSLEISGLTPRAFRLYKLVNKMSSKVVLMRLRFKDNKLPKTGTVKLAFNDRVASSKYLHRPKNVPRGAKLVPLLVKLQLPRSRPQWESLGNNNRNLEGGGESYEPIPKWRPYARPEVQCIDLCSSEDDDSDSCRQQQPVEPALRTSLGVTIPRIAPHLTNFWN